MLNCLLAHCGTVTGHTAEICTLVFAGLVVSSLLVAKFLPSKP